MCNPHSMTKGQAEIDKLAGAMRDFTGNLPPMPGIFPDYPASIVQIGDDGKRELALARWGMPSSKKALLDAATKPSAFGAVFAPSARSSMSEPSR